jgi:two-component system phosphate regulon response regulator PhoB
MSRRRHAVAVIGRRMERTGPILVVEDEEDIRRLVIHQLEREGWTARGAADGAEAIDFAKTTPPILVVLDMMLPGLPGTEVCRRLRAQPETRDVPIIILSARGEEIDRVVGFEVGADDYVTKPFSPRELVLRVRAVLRRRGGPTETAAETTGALEVGQLRVDEAAHRVFVAGEEVALTATEFKLLLTLMRRSGRVQSRAQLLTDVWDLPGDMYTRTVDTHMKRLREKLREASGHIETVRGVGYRFSREPVPEE